MDILKKKIEEAHDLLASITQKLNNQIFLSEQDFFLVLSRMNDLNAIQTQTVNEIVALTGCTAEECLSVKAIESLLEEHNAKQKIVLLEKEISVLVHDFISLAGEGDYGFALQPFQEKLASTEMEALIAMEKSGDLQPYRQVLEFVGKTGLTPSVVEDVAHSFGFHVAFGLLGNKYVRTDVDVSELQNNQDDPMRSPIDKHLPPESVQLADSDISAPIAPENHEAAAIIASENNAEQSTDLGQTTLSTSVMEPDEELELPAVDTPELTIDKSPKKPKGEAAFLSVGRKYGHEIGTAFSSIAYFILDEWGCRKSIIHKEFESSYALNIIERVVNLLEKEGYIASFKLSSDDTDDLYYSVTSAGYQVIAKDGLQRKLHRKPKKYGFPNITNSAVFARLRRMNDTYTKLNKIPDCTITRTLESGFAGMEIKLDDRPTIGYIPLMFASADTKTSLLSFLDYYNRDRFINHQTTILVEICSEDAGVWESFLREHLDDTCQYFIGKWNNDIYEDNAGNIFEISQLVALLDDESDEATEDTISEEELAGETSPAEVVPDEFSTAIEVPADDDTPPTDGHTSVESNNVEVAADDAAKEDTSDLPHSDIPDEHTDDTAVYSDPVNNADLHGATEESVCSCCDGKSAEELAQLILEQQNPLSDAELLDKLVICLAANKQTMEALTLAKALSGASKEPLFHSRYQSLLHASNLPLGNRDFAEFLTTDIMPGDTFGWYCHVCAAFWAACFPKTAYDHSLYFNIEGMVESQMDSVFTGDLVDVKSAMALLTNELRTLSFEHGDGAGLSAMVLESLASNAVLEVKQKKLMRAAREKMRNPKSSISLPGLEQVLKNILGPTGELYACMRIISENLTAEYSVVKDLFAQFSDVNGIVTEEHIDEYIDAQWDAARKADHKIQVKRLTNGSAARNTLIREISSRLEHMDEWLKRNARIAGDVGQIDSDRFKVFVNRFRSLVAKSCVAIDNAVATQVDHNSTAGLIILRSALEQIDSIIAGDTELHADPKDVFVSLLTTEYPILDNNGDPILDISLNDLPGMEPWRMLLQHISSPKVTFEEALAQTDTPEACSSRYEDYGSAAILRYVLGFPAEDRVQEDSAAHADCRDKEDAFYANVRLACAYGQIAEETKETVFAQLSRYRELFIPHTLEGSVSQAQELVCGNYAHFRFLLRCLENQIEIARAERKQQFLSLYEDRVQALNQKDIPSMLIRVKREIENDTFATAEQYLIRYDSGETELPQETTYAAETNFHDHFVSCADWYCEQCELPENKNGGKPHIWGNRVLQKKNFWTSNNERKSSGILLENWPIRKDEKDNPYKAMQFLRTLGFDIVSVQKNSNIPSTKDYEVFTADIKPLESGKEDYSHPVAKFGTLQTSTMHIVCLYGCKSSATLINIMTKKLQLGGNTIVLMDGTLTMLERRRVAAQFKAMTSGQNSFLLIDRVLMLYLAALDSGSRLNAMLQCTLPYTYEQLYSEGAGAVADEMFMGRIADRKSLCDPNGACLVYGGRQLGKTALLRRVESINNKPADGRYAIYLDIKDQGSEFFVKKLKKKLMAIETRRGHLLDGTEETLDDICDSLQSNIDFFSQLTVLVDEVDTFFEEISVNKYNAIHPVTLLQEEFKGKVKFVFAGTHNVAATTKGVDGNTDILKLKQPLCIKPLSNADAMQLIRRPLSYLGFNIGEQQIALILANTNSYPGLIHLFCNSLVKSICDNYGKYYDAGRGNPPYTVSDEQLKTIFREKDIKREIERRVIATIKLNKKYSVVANLLAFMAYRDMEKGISKLYGYSPAEVQQCNMQEFENPEFMPNRMHVSDLDALMEEMEKMGILWKNPQTGTYRFRQTDFLGYIGSYDQVMDALLGGV